MTRSRGCSCSWPGRRRRSARSKGGNHEWDVGSGGGTASAAACRCGSHVCSRAASRTWTMDASVAHREISGSDHASCQRCRPATAVGRRAARSRRGRTRRSASTTRPSCRAARRRPPREEAQLWNTLRRSASHARQARRRRERVRSRRRRARARQSDCGAQSRRACTTIAASAIAR